MSRTPKTADMFSPSGTDFEAIPPTVKRKYFSTLERLRYAQGQPPPEPTPSPTMNIFRPKSAGAPKQKSAHLRRPSLFQIRTSVRHSDQVPESPRFPAGQTPTSTALEDAEWYERLPEKIKRNHFTFEERHAFVQNERHQPDGADEQLFYHLHGDRQYANKSTPSLSSCSDVASAREEVLKTPMDMQDSGFESFRLLDNETSSYLPLDEYHNHIAKTANVSKIIPAHQRARTFTSTSASHSRPSLDRGRTMDFLPSTFARDSSEPSLASRTRARSPSRGRLADSVTSSSSSSFGRPTASGRLSLLERRSLKRSSSHADIPPVPQIDPSAAHVSDPVTRLKLKLFLSSVAKFDEALEFGFPSLGSTTPSQSEFSPVRPSPSSRVTNRRSLSVGAPPVSVRRSLASSCCTNRESVAIGTTFFYDDYDSGEEEEEGGEEEEEQEEEGGEQELSDSADIDTVRDSSSLHNTGMESDGTAVEYDQLPVGIAELPAELPADPVFVLLRPAKPTIIDTNASSFLPGPPTISAATVAPNSSSSEPLRLSRSISLKPRLNTSMDASVTALPPLPQSAKDFTALGRSELRTPQTPLKPWMEPEDAFGEREMTLRLTLTRKDLRADESLIYPDGGAGSWASSGDRRESSAEDRDPAGSGKWKFWSKRR